MKNFIPIASLLIGSVFIQNCAERDDEMASITETPVDNSERDDQLMSKDSTDSSDSDSHLYPDPPVRDGDNWRMPQKKHNP